MSHKNSGTFLISYDDQELNRRSHQEFFFHKHVYGFYSFLSQVYGVPPSSIRKNDIILTYVWQL